MHVKQHCLQWFKVSLGKRSQIPKCRKTFEVLAGNVVSHFSAGRKVIIVIETSGGDFFYIVGDDMASAERDPITGVRGGAPSGVQALQEQSPWSWGQGRSPREAGRKLNFDNTIIPLILHLSKHFEVSKKSLMTRTLWPRMCGSDQSRREAKS